MSFTKLKTKQQLIDNLVLGAYTVEESTSIANYMFPKLKGLDLELATKRCQAELIYLEIKRNNS